MDVRMKHTVVIAVVSILLIGLVSAGLLHVFTSNRVPDNSPASLKDSRQSIGYLSFLKEHTDSEWHGVWEQLWANAWTVRVPASIVKQYGSTQEAADKVLEHIRAYAFWADLPVDAQLGFGKNAAGDLELTGFIYYVNADEVILAVDKALSSALSAIMKEEDPKQRIVLIDRYLRQNIVYDDGEPQEGQTIHSALVAKRAVCAGFAYSFNVLALLADLDSHIVTGYTSVRQAGGEYHVVRHAWNVVTIDGVDYMTDTTTNVTSRTRKVVNVTKHEMDVNYYIVVEGVYAPYLRLMKEES